MLWVEPELRHMGSKSFTHVDLHVTAQVWADSKALTVPVQTIYKSSKNSRQLLEPLILPINYSDLPANASVAITLWEICSARKEHAYRHLFPFGGTTLPLFDAECHALKGRQKCCIHRYNAADGNVVTTTPAFSTHLPQNNRNVDDSLVRYSAEVDRIETMLKRLEMGEISKVEWLDQLIFRACESETRHAAVESLMGLHLQRFKPTSSSRDEAASIYRKHDLSRFFLHVELPMFDHPVVFEDHEYPIHSISTFQPLRSVSQPPSSKVASGAQYDRASSDDVGNALNQVVQLFDPEIGQRENPAETKHRRLARSQHRNGLMDKDLKPDALARDELNSLLAVPPTYTLSSDNKDLIWKFRFHLIRDKRALTKFVKSVNWDDPVEMKQAIPFLDRWAAIDVDDALELLGPSFSNPAVRAFAVSRLHQADDNELLLYLLQLVQALKFEHINRVPTANSEAGTSLAQLLIKRAADNFLLGNYFYWYLMVECDDESVDQLSQNCSIYHKVAYGFMAELERRPDGPEIRKTLKRQAELVQVLSHIASRVKDFHSASTKKAEELRKMLHDPQNGLMHFDHPVPLPLDPSIRITGVSTTNDEVAVFKSSLHPIKITFNTNTGGKYQIIFKKGDDLRQDQLCIQIITLMDQLLQKENLDLRLTPYKILATSPSAGASQFVESRSLQNLVERYRSSKAPVLEYLKIHNPDHRGPLGVRKEVLDNYVRSCAGYTVITYILGVGDRHLDNLLLTPDGHFFHADFGFILGRDPKPMAPSVKVSKEMVDAMGGNESEHYRTFKQYCSLAYTALRKSSNLILNLFSLMVDANIPAIKYDPEKAELKVMERMVLHLSEQDAIKHLESTIEDAYNDIGGTLNDLWHGWYQGMKS